MSGTKKILGAIAVSGLLLLFIPAYGAVFVNNVITVQTNDAMPFAYLTNNTSPLPASDVMVNYYGSEANVSLTGTWQLSNTSQMKNVDGFLAQALAKNADASTFIEVSQLTGSANLSQLMIYLNQSNSPGQLEAEYSSGGLVSYGSPVSIGSQAPLNLSISFSPHTSSNKIIQYYHVYMSLTLVTFVKSQGGSAYINETVNIAITEQIF